MTERHVGCDCQLPAGGWRPGAPPSKEAASPRHPPRCTHSRGGGSAGVSTGKPRVTAHLTGPSTPGAPRQPGSPGGTEAPRA